MPVKLLPSIFITAVCVFMQFVYPVYLTDGASCLLYHFTHANVFHFLANIVALFQFRPRIKTCVVGFVAASVAGMLPFASVSLPTCGLSGFIMGCYARRYVAYHTSVKYIILTNVIFAFIPIFNWKIHLLSFFIAYLYYYGEKISHTRTVH